MSNKQVLIMENFIIEENVGSEKLFNYVKRIKISERVIDEPHLIKNPKIIVYGRNCRQNRSVGFFSDSSNGYKYSNQIMKSQKLTPVFKRLLEDVNKRYGTSFNGILLNMYENGSEYIGKHRDDESGLDTNKKAIGSISYGSERTFRIRDNEGKIVRNIKTKHGMFMMMFDNFQEMYTHEIPIEKKIKEPRWSLTFREHKE